IVTLTGPTTVTKKSINEYTLSIFQTGAQDHGGLNVSAASGVLATGGGNSTFTQTLTAGSRAEITHTSPKPASDGVVVFSFLWTAPNTVRTVSLNAWGNAVNADFTDAGDAATAATLSVMVVNAISTPTNSPSHTPTATTAIP